MTQQGTHRIARARYWAVAAALAALASPGVAAACAVSIEPAQDELVVRHNPLEATAAHGTIEVNVVNRGDTECVGTLGASLLGEQYGLWSDASARPILYQLVNEKSREDVTPRGGRNLDRRGGRAIRLAPGERSLEIVSLTAIPDSGVSQGRYMQDLSLELVTAEGLVLGSRPVTMGLEIVPAAHIGLKGVVARARGANSIDLGELEPGIRHLPVVVYVLSTGGYRVSVMSENLGQLKHVDADWFIDYRMRLGKHDLDLTTADSFEIVSGRARVDNYPMRLEIGETAGKRAGTYVDRVTFTVAAL